jgi:hypothetical protein
VVKLKDDNLVITARFYIRINAGSGIMLWNSSLIYNTVHDAKLDVLQIFCHFSVLTSFSVKITTQISDHPISYFTEFWNSSM